MVDLSQVNELRGIKEADGGLEIGATTTLTEVVNHPVVKDKFGLLMEAAELVASPQIRNQGTLGGNVSQDTRCWYYRSGWSCYRAGGNICYADTPTAINREHAILDADRCVAVSPSDTAPALIALDAKMVIRSKSGERVVDAEDYFLGPDIDITRMNVLRPGELLDGDPDSGHVGGRAVLLREGARPERVGLPARQRRVGDEVLGRQDRQDAHRGRRGGGAAAAPGERSNGSGGQAAQRRNGRHGGQAWRSRAPSRCATTATRFR